MNKKTKKKHLFTGSYNSLAPILSATLNFDASSPHVVCIAVSNISKPCCGDSNGQVNDPLSVTQRLTGF